MTIQTIKSSNGWDLTLSGSAGCFYLNHANGTDDQMCVARFKYASPKASARHFAKFLMANFTPAEYRDLRNAPDAPPPVAILKAKGFESYNVLRAAKLAAQWEAEKVAA